MRLSFTQPCALALLLCAAATLSAQGAPPPDDATILYKQLQNPALERSTGLSNVVLQRDRVTITFATGTIYFSAPVAGRVRSAVFIGSGTFHATPPPVAFEQDNVRRLLKSDDVSAEFRSAVLRFTDDTDQMIPRDVPASPPPEQAVRLVSEFEPRLLKETGMNISARQLESILNKESPGVFLGQFSGGKHGRFTFLSDPQSRTLLATFGIDAGETGIIFSYNEDLRTSDVWMAFCPREAYASGVARYSDSYNLVDTPHYALSLDLMEPKKILGIAANVDLISRTDGLRALSFAVGEDLAIYDDERRKKQLRVLGAKLADGTALTYFQEPWEGGFTVVLPAAARTGQPISLALNLNGDFMQESNTMPGTYFPRSTVSWYPRHGFLVRSSFDISMTHRRKDRVASIGELVKESPSTTEKDAVMTEFRMSQPVGLASFAVGPYEIHKETAKDDNGRTLPLEFYSMPGSRAAIKEDFILAEMSNCVRFFGKLFGEYPYPLFRGVYHPFNYGQGFATTIMIPATDMADYFTYSFIAHETSHQWWGDMVTWRSYRDQWLSEGFAEYSGMLYVQTRDKTAREIDLIKHARETLKFPPHNIFGPGPGRLVDVGPLIMGHRVETRETRGAYTALTYSKGALVLRMMHFLFTDPQTGDGQAFLDLMSDFVRRHLNSTATTEQFFAVANDRVQNTPLARRYGYKDLNWFYRQWVTQTYLPSYELSYHLEDQPDRTVLLKGQLYQKGLPEKETWFTPIPLVIRYPGGKFAHGTIAVQGERTPINLKLPMRPDKIELDPDLWILSDKTSVTKD